MKAILALALVQGANGACDATREQVVLRNAHDCVMAQAQRLASSGEKAETVAEAALTKCRPALSMVRDAEGLCRGYQPAVWFMEGLVGHFRKDAVLIVVEARASRHR